jgi:F0F1-type ATP synthase assembly protein I
MASAMRWAHLVSSIGIELVAPIAGGAWLDIKYQTKPWLMITGVLVGTFLGFLGLKKLIQELDKSKADQQKLNQENPPTKQKD